jgi:hypothetical protein
VQVDSCRVILARAGACDHSDDCAEPLRGAEFGPLSRPRGVWAFVARPGSCRAAGPSRMRSVSRSARRPVPQPGQACRKHPAAGGLCSLRPGAGRPCAACPRFRVGRCGRRRRRRDRGAVGQGRRSIVRPAGALSEASHFGECATQVTVQRMGPGEHREPGMARRVYRRRRPRGAPGPIGQHGGGEPGGGSPARAPVLRRQAESGIMAQPPASDHFRGEAAGAPNQLRPIAFSARIIRRGRQWSSH